MVNNAYHAQENTSVFSRTVAHMRVSHLHEGGALAEDDLVVGLAVVADQRKAISRIGPTHIARRQVLSVRRQAALLYCVVEH